MRSALQILIIGDEEILTANLKTYLGRCASDVRIAPDANAAAALFGSFVPDLVVLDHSRPGIDPLPAYEKLVSGRPKPPRCLLLTADPKWLSARARGMWQVLGKPFSLAELQNAVDACMRDP